MREVRREILPELRNMGVKIMNYQAENEQMKEMIRRFDEVLSEKASKSALSELEYSVDQSFVKK